LPAERVVVARYIDTYHRKMTPFADSVTFSD